VKVTQNILGSLIVAAASVAAKQAATIIVLLFPWLTSNLRVKQPQFDNAMV
jgi:hypothetical protein